MRNVLLVVADELMAAVLSCYGGIRVDTPGLDRLAAEGVVFDRAYCNAPVCTPSRYSMLTGRYPWSLGVYHNQSPTPVHAPSIATMLAGSGYRTAAIGKMHFKGDEQMWGYQRRPYGDFGGLSHQPDPIDTAPRLSFVADAGPADIPEEDLHDVIAGRMACDYLRTLDRDRPFFLHVGFNFPHYPLRPPQRLFDKYFPDRADLPAIPEAPSREHPWMRERRAVYRGLLGEGSFTPEQVGRARAAYYACVELVDEQLGGLLQVLADRDLARQTLVIVTADHGEMLGEYGTWEKNCFYEPSVRVPLLVRAPGWSRAGSRITDVVELVDLLATVRDWCGIAGDDDGDGESLRALIAGVPGREKDHAISELAPTYVRGLARMVRRGRWKRISYGDATPSLFDLESDPQELHDLGLDDDPPRPDPMVETLSEFDFATAARESVDPELAVHPSYADMTPNQYRGASGMLRDAETFYDGTSWSVPTRPVLAAMPRVRPAPPPAAPPVTTR